MVVCECFFMMGKLSNEDKMRSQTLREQGLGAKAVRASYPDKNWSLSTLQTICRRVDETGSAMTRCAGSGGRGLHVKLSH